MRERTKSYEALMKRPPSLRVTSTAGSVAFRNVPHRIVALGGDPAALAAAAERFADEPDIKLDVVPGQTAAGSGDPEPDAKRRHLYQGLVEPDGIEPTTSAVRLLRSPN